jgi:hypothetical protein
MSEEPVRKNISTKIIRRFMSDDEWNDFIRKYRDNRQTSGWGRSRAENLSEAVSQAELDNLKSYIQDTDTPVSQIAEAAGMSGSKFAGQVERAALKWLYQHQEVLK